MEIKKVKTDIFVPADVIELINGYLGKTNNIIPVLFHMVDQGQLTWDAVRCAIHNLETGYLKFTYVRKFGDDGVEPKGGCTVVFATPEHLSNTVLTVAISWCNEKDTFYPKLGRLLAAINFVRNHTVQIRLMEQGRWSEQLKYIFGPCVGNQRVFEN